MTFGDTILPWLLGTLLVLALSTLVITVKSWREMKRSRYFFLRRQAEKRMQNYSLASLVLFLATGLTSGYAWQTPVDNTARVAVLVNAKPPKEEIVELLRTSAKESIVEDVVPEAIDFKTLAPVPSVLFSSTAEELLSLSQPVLPEEFDAIEPAIELDNAVSIGNLLFSTELASDLEPINPRLIFAEGSYTLYATFDYQSMPDGVEWSWVWRHNGEVVAGGNELWDYGQNGQGYVYLSPPEGFQNGEYALEVWIDGKLYGDSAVVMNNAAVAAGN